MGGIRVWIGMEWQDKGFSGRVLELGRITLREWFDISRRLPVRFMGRNAKSILSLLVDVL